MILEIKPLPQDIHGNYAELTLPSLDVTVGVSPTMSGAYMRLHFAMVEARIMMWLDGGGEVETYTRPLSSQWRADLLEEWDEHMVESKRVGYPEAL